MPKINVKDKRKQQLMNAAIESIVKHGITGTTITTMSQGAKMSRGIINFYFTSKEKMMQDTCKHLVHEYVTVWQSALEDASDPLAALRAIVEVHFAGALCNTKRLTVMSAFWGHATSHPEYRKILAKGDEALIEKIQALYDAAPHASASGIAGHVFAHQLLALIRGSWLAYLLSPSSLDRKSLAEGCVAFVETQCAAPAAKPSKAPKLITEEKKAPAKKPAEKPKAEEQAQLDFGDLFSAKG